MVFVLELLKGVALLATGVLFLLEGLSFGCIEVSGMVSLYKHDRDEFLLGYSRGLATWSFTYFLVEILVGMINGYYDIFILICGVLGLGISVATIACISQKYETWMIPLGLTGIPLTAKVAHTGYFIIDTTLKEDSDAGLYTFLVVSLAFECVLLLGWSLWPFLTVESDEQSIPLTAWGLEYADIVSHLMVCIFYANNIAPLDHWHQSDIMQAYFAFWIINLFLWAIPLYPMLYLTNGNDQKIRVFIAWHIVIVDLLTDLPMMIITLAGRTYVGNIYIACDIAVKIILFIRGLVWVPIVVFREKITASSFGAGLIN